MVRGLGADVWVAGEHGAGRLEIRGDAREYGWTECDTRGMGLRQIQRLMPGEHGDLQFVGTSAASEAGVVARCQESRLEVVATSPQMVHASPPRQPTARKASFWPT